MPSTPASATTGVFAGRCLGRRDRSTPYLSQGGTIVPAGDLASWLLYALSLGYGLSLISDAGSSAMTAGWGVAGSRGTFRMHRRASGATPLLVVVPGGDTVALRMPYRQGSLVVLATPVLLTNAGASVAQATVRFSSYARGCRSETGSGALLFDEVHHSFAPAGAEPATADQLLFTTAPGRALLYAGCARLFCICWLSGR